MDDAAELYGLPLDRFVTERTALAKALRGAGQRDEAARVAKLAKPTAAAWVVNQLVRTQRAQVATLFATGDALRQAQSEVVQGRGGAGALREAAEAKRSAIDELVVAARGLLDEQGHGPSEATLARVSATLDAAALQDAARAQVSDGCLTRELEHIGLGDVFDADLVAPPASAAPRRTPSRAAATDRESESERRARAREQEARRSAAVQRATRELAQAQARRDRAARDVQDAQSRLDAASAQLAMRERELADASERAEQVRNAQE